jgi:hypothetical protein
VGKFSVRSLMLMTKLLISFRLGVVCTRRMEVVTERGARRIIFRITLAIGAVAGVAGAGGRRGVVPIVSVRAGSAVRILLVLQTVGAGAVIHVDKQSIVPVERCGRVN